MEAVHIRRIADFMITKWMRSKSGFPKLGGLRYDY
jgi:hypothetical protein